MAKKNIKIWDIILYIIATIGIIAGVIGIFLLIYKILTGT